jgi:hypothetical protein
MQDLLREMVTRFRYDRLTMDELQAATKVLADEIGAHEHVLDVLWQNGMLGYDAEAANCPTTHFYTASEVDDFKLPTGKQSYVLHPCLAHRVPIEPKGPPVSNVRSNDR